MPQGGGGEGGSRSSHALRKGEDFGRRWGGPHRHQTPPSLVDGSDVWPMGEEQFWCKKDVIAL